MSALAELVTRQHVIVCCGTGGVGKTTAAATLGMEGARLGRSVVVVTIDPAKRLADALGLEGLGNRPHTITRARWDPQFTAPTSGRLAALMLDTKSTFDGLVRRYARSPEQADRILANSFYRSIAGALSGTQEYMAAEKLNELHDEGNYDLIVVDTPPTRHALDFIDAPHRLTRLLDNRVFRLLMMPTRASLRVASVAAQAFLRTVSRVVGSEVVEDIIAFFRAFEGMEQGFRDRAHAMLELLSDPTTSFVLVTSPRRDACDEAEFFAQRLLETGLVIDALIVNRVHPAFGESNRTDEYRARAAELEHNADCADVGARAAALRLGAAYGALAELTDLATTEQQQLEDVARRIGARTLATVPVLPHDVHDFATLAEVGAHLFDGVTRRDTRPVHEPG